jgi:hypothetical protein
LYNLYYGAIAGVVVFLVRFVQVDAHRRRRMRLMVYAAGAALLVTLLSSVLPTGTAAYRVVEAVSLAVTTAVPLAIVVGVLQHRLYDVDVAVRRSAV